MRDDFSLTLRKGLLTINIAVIFLNKIPPREIDAGFLSNLMEYDHSDSFYFN